MNVTNERIILKSSTLKRLIEQRIDAIDAMKHARMLKDKSWESKEMHHCRRLNYWIRTSLHNAFTLDLKPLYIGRIKYSLNCITELGDLIV